MNTDIATDGEQDVAEKYGGQLHGPMSVRLWLRMLSCTMVVEKRLRRRFIEQFDTTLPRFDVLAALDRRDDGMAMGDLSQMLLVSNGNVTAIVRQLQNDGLVDVEPAEHDRRSLIVTMTKKGRASFADMAAAQVLMRGGSAIVSPLGEVLAGPAFDGEAILYADIDLDEIVRGKYDFDVVGHYARPDIFALSVDERARVPVGRD